MSSFNLIATQIKYRLFWYQKKTFEKLIRFKHGLLIFIALFVPTAGFLITLITQPILSVVHPTSVAYTYLFNIAVIQLIYLGWITSQRDAVYPDVIKNYFQSLPINQWINRLVDVLVIFVANNLFWIPFIATFLMRTHLPTADKNLFLLKLFTLIVSVITIQITWFYKRSLAILILIFVDLLLYLNIIFPSVIIPILAIVISISSILFFDFRSVSNSFLSLCRVPYKFRFPSITLADRFPRLMLQFYTLWRKYRIELLVRLAISLGIIALGYGIVVIGGEISPLQISILVTSSTILILSGVYPLLKETRDSYSLYLKSLPFNELNWYVLDYIILVMMTIMLSAVFIFLLLINHKMNFIIILYSLLTLLPIGILLGYTRNLFPKQGTWISTIAVIACIIPIEWHIK